MLTNVCKITRMSETLKNRISERLEVLGLNYTSAARKVGKRKDLFNNLFRGSAKSPTTNTLELMAIALNTSTNWLLTGNHPAEFSKNSDVRMANEVDVSWITHPETIPNTIPIFGNPASALKDGCIIINPDKIYGYAPEVPMLSGIPGAYCLYTSGSSMKPAFKTGRLVYINPNKAAALDDLVIVQLNRPGKSTTKGYIKLLSEITENIVSVVQYHPQKTIEFPQFTGDQTIEYVKSIHRIEVMMF